jgi:PAS domain S-box-containing protein
MNGKIVHLNKVAEKICGVLENQVVGNHVEEIFNIHSIENLPLIDDILNEVFSTGQPKLIFNQIKLISIDFKEYFLTCNFSPIQNRTNETEGIVIAFSDITLQNDLKSSLVQSEELFRAVFESSANSLIVFNIEGNISKVNEAFYSLFGYSKKEIDTNKISYQDLTYLEDIAMSSDTFNNLISGKIQNASFEKRFISKNNDLFWGLVTTAIVYKHDKTPLFVVSQIVNISERKNAEIELKASNDELSHITMELSLAKDKAENSDRIKTAFLANMSHEIRTPMNGIIGVADLLVESNLEIEERKRFVEIMHSSCNRLLSTINDIFDASKIASNQIELVETEFSISSLIDNLNNHFNPLFIQKQLLFKVKVLASIDLNKTLLGDYQKLFQILSNLLNNALKFTHQGMVTLTCDFQKTNYQFLIEDTGVGISDEYKKNIFSNFSQEDMSMNRGFEGSGLGLVIAKGYTELLNGTIRFNSEKNVGSTFILEVPLKDIVEISTSSKKIISNPDLFELTFLVAEDDDISFYLVEKLLKREFGATVIRAKNGMEAYNLFVNNQNIEIILMDIKMPIMDGFECVEKIRLINNEIPIIAVTAYAFSADQQMAIEVGCNDYISKPYNWSLLIEKIKSFVG